MPEGIQKEYQEILNQIFIDVFLQSLNEDLDGGTFLNENDQAELNDLIRRLLVPDESPPIDREDIQMLLADEEFRDYLSRSINTFIKYQSKESQNLSADEESNPRF